MGRMDRYPGAQACVWAGLLHSANHMPVPPWPLRPLIDTTSPLFESQTSQPAAFIQEHRRQISRERGAGLGADPAGAVNVGLWGGGRRGGRRGVLK